MEYYILAFPLVQIGVNCIAGFILKVFFNFTTLNIEKLIMYLIYPSMVLITCILVFYVSDLPKHIEYFVVRFNLSYFILFILLPSYYIAKLTFKVELKYILKENKRVEWWKAFLIPLNNPLIFLLIILISFGEEIIFRFFMINKMLSFTESTMLSILLSSILFAINHLYFGLKHVFSKFLMGLWFSVIFIYTHNLLLLCLIHLFYNLFVFATITKNFIPGGTNVLVKNRS